MKTLEQLEEELAKARRVYRNTPYWPSGPSREAWAEVMRIRNRIVANFPVRYGKVPMRLK